MPVQSDFSFDVPADPEEVAARIKSRTRWRPVPDQGSVLGGGEKPLGGHVSSKGFRVALDKRDWLTLYQAVAQAKLTQTATGTFLEVGALFGAGELAPGPFDRRVSCLNPEARFGCGQGPYVHIGLELVPG